MLRGKLKTRWPSREDLLSWWIWHKINVSPVCEFDDPEMIRGWVDEFRRGGLIDTHRLLYKTYGDFRIEFANPNLFVVNGGTIQSY